LTTRRVLAIVKHMDKHTKPCRDFAYWATEFRLRRLRFMLDAAEDQCIRAGRKVSWLIDPRELFAPTEPAVFYTNAIDFKVTR
jgi:hypothetical protein